MKLNLIWKDEREGYERRRGASTLSKTAAQKQRLGRLSFLVWAKCVFALHFFVVVPFQPPRFPIWRKNRMCMIFYSVIRSAHWVLLQWSETMRDTKSASEPNASSFVINSLINLSLWANVLSMSFGRSVVSFTKRQTAFNHSCKHTSQNDAEWARQAARGTENWRQIAKQSVRWVASTTITANNFQLIALSSARLSRGT